MLTKLLAGATLAALALPTPAVQSAPATIPGAADRLPADLVALIPADATGLVFVSPINTLEAAIQDLLQVVAPDMAPMADVDQLLHELGPSDFDFDLIDRSRPMAFAMGAITPTITEEPPQFYLLIPSTNPAELSAALPFPPELGWTRISGGYLGISPEAVYPVPGARSNLPARLPQGLIAATIDAEPILETFGPMARLAAGMARSGVIAGIQSDTDLPGTLKPMANDAATAIIDGVMDTLDSLTGFDLALNLEGARFEAGYAMTFAEGSPMAALCDKDGAHLVDLAHLLDPAADLTVAVGMDLGGAVRWARPFVNEILDAIPVPEQAGEDLGPFRSPRHAMDVARESLSHGMDALTWFGDGIALSTFLGEEHNRTAVWMHGVQADNLTGSLRALFEAELASLVGLSLEETMLGENTRQLALHFDAATLAHNFDLGVREAEQVRAGFEETFGDAVRVSLTPVGGNTLVFFNGDAKAIKAALTVAAHRPGTQDPAIQRMTTELGDAHPFAAYRVNLGPVVAEMMSLAETFDEGGEIPPGMASMVRGLHLPLTVHEGMTPTRWFQGMSIDLTRAGDLAAMLMEREQAAELQPVR
ncbi:MAG: hypothetical protein P1V81_06195 [Planctomycetota bacterium]|nr:hypothetical protein [Planctomycetota bacterium]